MAANSAALIEALKRAYPEAGLGIALDRGAKVNKGEMKWSVFNRTPTCFDRPLRT